MFLGDLAIAVVVLLNNEVLTAVQRKEDRLNEEVGGSTVVDRAFEGDLVDLPEDQWGVASWIWLGSLCRKKQRSEKEEPPWWRGVFAW